MYGLVADKPINKSWTDAHPLLSWPGEVKPGMLTVVDGWRGTYTFVEWSHRGRVTLIDPGGEVVRHTAREVALVVRNFESNINKDV